MKRWLITLACLLLLTGNMLAGDKAKPNTLTDKEIQDGWLLLFDGETTFGWTIDGEAKVHNGTLVLGGEKGAKARLNTKFRHFALSYEYECKKGGIDSDPIYVTYIGGVKQPVRVLLPGAWRSESQQYQDVVPLLIEIHVPDKARLTLKNVKLRPMGLQSIFNGKDLTGWKEHPGKKSTYTVTKEGWLNVKDGPGDLQTEGKWKDFVLQLECISNGKHLNSGIFFRCLPDVYQQGYEAQIRNEFTPGKMNTYMLDNYDPVSKKLLGKIKVESPAVDFGTGAIYRRQPARKQVSKDFEWFTMTVVANGNHFATWVNGIQVTDWTDHRPLHDNARNGCCLNAGHLSIQGHDPTTDLSFRNFRIAEMK